MPVVGVPFIGNQTVLSYKIGSATEVNFGVLNKSITPGAITNEKVDTTGMISTGKTSLPSIPDYGDESFEVFYVPSVTGIAAIRDMQKNRTIATWSKQYPDGSSANTGTKESYTGYLTSVNVTGVTNSDAVLLACTVARNSDITITPAT